MGEGPALLLVRGLLAGRRLALLASVLLTGCDIQPDRQAGSVDPAAYDAFYLWPGVRPTGDIRPKTLYLLDGEVRRGGAARFERLRMGIPRLPGKTIWLVVRAERLDWNDMVTTAIFNDLRRWQEAGNEVAGLQLDFDAATRGIEGYAKFLEKVRQRLPRTWRLSITGLMDWSAHGDPQALTNLAKTVDEVVVQTYQGRSTIPDYEDYFRRMENFPIPFRVALVEGGSWREPARLAQHPQFRGYAIFLLNTAELRR
ncbi:hypothetical protein BV95_03315 [Sphingobium chlorophenolicum]|uniref:DUF3142 domain-containing protein n=1 Tax=Sphingobium chlorophenolicum TaxID=46429 RepID=A0A081RB48_SPHCR|nr:DUF3142 domain-containing protein [Sphingobium chlorophenolicum]KEQ52421.1 hypothetical protein BV95_03315 [Sphingobium chlorophenolicum]